MREIEHQDPDRFTKFVNKTKIPIDGKDALLILLKILDSCNLQTTLKFVRYSQSNHVIKKTESSVSYASAIISYT